MDAVLGVDLQALAAAGRPVQRLRALWRSRATPTKTTARMGDTPVEFEQYAQPTPLQARAFELLAISYRL